VSTFRKKAQYKQIDFRHYDDFFDPMQLRKVKQAWNNSLQNHLKDGTLPDFDLVLAELKEGCSKLSWG
jgi:hypothetical protein